MGVNRAGFALVDESLAAEAAKQELIRRYFHYACEHAMGLAEEESVEWAKLLIDEFDLEPGSRPVVTCHSRLIPQLQYGLARSEVCCRQEH